jgi:DNA mismatch endonuclease (patch repair protein)
VAIFCDGDFWHGRNLAARIKRLAKGHNAPYWTAKVLRNVERDRDQTHRLQDAGWLVCRFWETDILERVEQIAGEVERIVASRRRERVRRRE